jgi:hypothetical protein
MFVSRNEMATCPVAAPINDGPTRRLALVQNGAGASVVVVVVVDVVGGAGVDIHEMSVLDG